MSGAIVLAMVGALLALCGLGFLRHALGRNDAGSALLFGLVTRLLAAVFVAVAFLQAVHS